MKKVYVYRLSILLMLMIFSSALYAQGSSRNYSGYNSQRSYGDYGSYGSYGSYGGNSRSSRSMSYPVQANMFGVMGGVFLTSNPDMSGYDVKKNYVDGGGGFVYNYRNDISEGNTFEVITSLMMASSSTSRTEEGEDKVKVTFPVEARWYIGHKDFKVFAGAGLQYNFIWSLKNSGNGGYYDYYGYYYDDYDKGMSTGAHQLSGNAIAGFCILGMSSPVHFLLGAKFHFPIINNAEGVEYSQSGRIDFSKDKTCVAATGGVSFNIKNKAVIMLNYDYPLGGNKQTEANGNFFQMHSQSLTMSVMWCL